MLFMKGSPDAPRCGFSRQITELLQAEKVKFDTFDILSDEEVRQGLKTFSNWPTFPQLYADGKLLGGLDVVKELQEEGELLEALPAAAIGQPLQCLNRAFWGGAVVHRFENVFDGHVLLPGSSWPIQLIIQPYPIA